MTRLLSLFGLMRVSEHERLLHHEVLQSIKASNRESDLRAEKNSAIKGEAKLANDLITAKATIHDLEAKYKQAVADLEKQAGEIAGYKHRAALADDLLNAQSAEILSLRPDALAMRRKRQMDRDRRKGR